MYLYLIIIVCGSLSVSISIYSFILSVWVSVCFVSNKRQNGWADRAKIFIVIYEGKIFLNQIFWKSIKYENEKVEEISHQCIILR